MHAERSNSRPADADSGRSGFKDHGNWASLHGQRQIGGEGALDVRSKSAADVQRRGPGGGEIVNLAYPDGFPQQSKSPLWPLNSFYASRGDKMPKIVPLRGENIPQPYRGLLVHERNMTSTLEAYHAGPIYIEPLNVVEDETETSREVILRRCSDDHPVEYGASWVFHRHLPPEASRMIREAKLPLGTILKRCQCLHSVEKVRFFKMQPAPFFSDIFRVPVSADLFGRRHRLVAPNGHAIAAVFEIVPPMKGDEREED